MPQPTPVDRHVNTLLTNLSIGYVNESYIADQIFPIVRVQKQSDILPTYDQSHWFRNLATLRAPATKSVRSGFNLTNTATYFCHRYSFGDEITDDERANADPVYANLDEEATEFVTDKLLMAREVNFTTNCFTTSKWTTDKTGGTDFTVWSNYGASRPIEDITDYRDTVEGLIAREPNTFVQGKQVWSKLRWHPDLVDLIKHTQIGLVSEQLFASAMGFGKVLIGRGIYTTTAEGTAEASVTYTRIWGKHALMVYVPDAPSLRRPAAGYTFVWTGNPNMAAGALQTIKTMRDEEREVDIIEANSYFDQKITAAGAGLFMSGAVA